MRAGSSTAPVLRRVRPQTQPFGRVLALAVSPWTPGKMGGRRGRGRETACPAHPHPSSRGGVGDLLYPAHFLVGSGHVTVDEATQLGPGSLSLRWEVIGKFFGDHLQNDPREDLGTKGGRGSKRLGFCPLKPLGPPAPLLLFVTQQPWGPGPSTRILLPPPCHSHSRGKAVPQTGSPAALHCPPGDWGWGQGGWDVGSTHRSLP